MIRGVPPARPNGILPFCGQEREPDLPVIYVCTVDQSDPSGANCALQYR